jgi:hypothetical protein
LFVINLFDVCYVQVSCTNQPGIGSFEKCSTYHITVATIIPTPMQSMKMTQRRRRTNCQNPSPNTKAQPIDETKNNEIKLLVRTARTNIGGREWYALDT